jgi:hypothetical protein
MTWWLDVLAIVTLLIVAFIVLAYGYRAWRMARHNEEGVAGGSMGDQMLGPPDKPMAPRPKRL